MSASSKNDSQWERVWRESTDESLIQCAAGHLWQNLQSPQPSFGRFSQICREAHRRGKPELLVRALERLVPIRTASGEDIRVLLGSIEALINAVTLAGQEIARLSAKKDEDLLGMMRQRLKEARVVAAQWKR